ncbi:MAG: hypothetical protein PHR68_01455 [Candidatus Gracilibacteria bacterium]|nr:hypothetical protein [Candidatus Gracilibacteria bacterium]
MENNKPFKVEAVTFMDRVNVAGLETANKMIGYTDSLREKLKTPSNTWLIVLGTITIICVNIKRFCIFVKTKTKPFFAKAKEKSLTLYEETKPKVEELFQKVKSKFSKKVEESSEAKEEVQAPQS